MTATFFCIGRFIHKNLSDKIGSIAQCGEGSVKGKAYTMINNYKNDLLRTQHRVGVISRRGTTMVTEEMIYKA